MFRLEGHDIGDAWYYGADDTVHMYFLTKPEGSAVGWDIGHAATRDLVGWEFLGLALTRGAPGSWDDKSLATGSVVLRDDRYWMAFTGHKFDEPLFVQRVGMAVSDDLVRWEKLPENPTSEADPAYYELVSTGERTLTHWRDPFLLDTGEEVVQYVCARRTDGDISSRGTVGSGPFGRHAQLGGPAAVGARPQLPRRWRSHRSTPSTAGTTSSSAPRSSGCPRRTGRGFADTPSAARTTRWSVIRRWDLSTYTARERSCPRLRPRPGTPASSCTSRGSGSC